MLSFNEYHQITMADYRIGKSGRKVHKTMNVKDLKDADSNGIPDSQEKDKLKMESKRLSLILKQRKK